MKRVESRTSFDEGWPLELKSDTTAEAMMATMRAITVKIPKAIG